MGSLPLDNPGAAAQVLHGLHGGGARRLVSFERYADGDEFKHGLDTRA